MVGGAGAAAEQAGVLPQHAAAHADVVQQTLGRLGVHAGEPHAQHRRRVGRGGRRRRGHHQLHWQIAQRRQPPQVGVHGGQVALRAGEVDAQLVE